MRWIVLSTALALAGCRHTPEPKRATATDPPEQLSQSPQPSESSADPSAPPPAPAPPPPGRLFYDLAAHPERAELERGEQVLLDFGPASDAKYTFGGWRSGTGGAYIEGSDVARLVSNKVARISLPARSTAAGRLSLRVRGFAPGPLTIHVNGQSVADLELSGSSFEQFDVELAQELLRRGENAVQLRVRRTGKVPATAQAAGLAIDWITLAPAGASEPASPPPTPQQLSPSPETLQIPAGHSVRFAFEVPERAELRGQLTSGQLEISALRDGQPPLPLVSATAGARPGDLRIDLQRISGELIGLQVSALETATLRRPRIVVVGGEDDKPAPDPVRNVVVVLIDTLRADKLSPYDPETRVKTPGLSTLLEDAAVMLRARSQENWTKPSVATLLSSLLPWQHHAVSGDAKLARSVELLPELLRERGFHTGAFIANGYVSDKFGFKQGWHSYRNYIREGRRTKAQYVAADVLDWLDKRPKDKPFFLYMHTIDPHVPYRPPSSFVSMYDGGGYNGVVDFSRTHELLEKIKVGSIKLRGRDKRYLEALYDAEITYHDVHFAAVMEGLRKRELADDTIVVVTSDHGEEFWDHGSVGHGHSVYDELLHVPLIIRVPGLTEGQQRVRETVGLLDVMPTILDALGQPIPEHLMGRSLMPELRGLGQSAPRASVAGFMNGWRSLSVGKLKYMQRTSKQQLLFDVDEDPGEMANLADERPIALRYVRGLLGLTLLDHEQPARAQLRKKRTHKKQRTVIDKQTEAQLRALGYIGTSAK